MITRFKIKNIISIIIKKINNGCLNNGTFKLYETKKCNNVLYIFTLKKSSEKNKRMDNNCQGGPLPKLM